MLVRFGPAVLPGLRYGYGRPGRHDGNAYPHVTTFLQGTVSGKVWILGSKSGQEGGRRFVLVCSFEHETFERRIAEQPE